MAIVSACGPWALTQAGWPNFAQQNLEATLLGPSWSHWAGTDLFGRDLLMRTLCGAQISLAVGLLGATLALAVGTLYGAAAGFWGGKLGSVMMRLVDLIDSLPYLFLVIILVSLFGKSLTLMFVTLGLVGWLMPARIVRGEILTLKEQDFVIAARSLGARPRRIFFVHLIPNTLPTLAVYFTLTVPNLVLQEAFLSFLGLGVQAPRPSLGSLIGEGIAHLHLGVGELVFPSAALIALLWAMNRQGERLRRSQLERLTP